MGPCFAVFSFPAFARCLILDFGILSLFCWALSRNFIGRAFETGGLGLVRQGKSPPKRSLDGAPWRAQFQIRNRPAFRKVRGEGICRPCDLWLYLKHDAIVVYSAV